MYYDKKIVNEIDLDDSLHYNKVILRSEFVGCDDVQLNIKSRQKLVSDILDFCRYLPHDRLVVFLRNLEGISEITVNPVTATA